MRNLLSVIVLVSLLSVLSACGGGGIYPGGGGGTPPVAPAITTQPQSKTVTAPQTATFTVVASGTAPLSYQWKKNNANISGATSASYTTPATTTADNGTSFIVTVSNSVGNVTSNAAILTVNAASLTPQTITFANPGTQTVGTPLTLSATASSGLAVLFASTTTGVCTVSGTTATFIASGSCTIQATQPGNSSYAAASPVSQSFTVNGRSQTITFNNPGIQTIGTPLTLSATASSGLAVSFASTTTSVCTVSGTTATFIAAGTCTIQATQPGNSTYAAATPISQSFTVNPATKTPQTITFNNPGTQTVGTPLTLVATASSGLTVSFASQTTSICTVSGATATFITAGTCTIQATQSGNGTYAAATPVSQSFTVNAAGPVLVTSITIQSTASVAVGATTTLTATVLPANATNKTLTWMSNDTTTATVSASGVVTGIKTGTVTVTAESTDGSNVTSNDCIVTVNIVSPSDDPTKNHMGINIGSSLDWETNRIFADVMKTSREWSDTSWSSSLPASALDANGWPMQDASIAVWAGIDNMQGTYALSFNGQATVTASWGSATITNQVYDPSTNLTTAKLVYNSTGQSALLLIFTNTKRTAASATNSGVNDVALMRPKTVGGTVPYTTEVFTAPFLAALSEFTVMRTMDFTATNGNESVNWSDRTRPINASQAVGNPAAPAGGWQGHGAAWEYAILLANQTGKDLWINVPLNATDDFITKLAQLTKYGSDGTTPYTSTQASPVWPGLDPNLRLYVEFSNEVWNTAGAFQGNENHDEAVAEVTAGGSPLNFDGETNDWFWAWRRPAKRIVEISKIFRTVWGDSAMMSHVRPVLMSQLGYADGPLLQEMLLMVNYYDNPNYVSSPHPPSYYVYGVGGSGYYNPSDESTVDAIFSTMASGLVPALQGDANWALAFGLKRIAYEGGPSFDKTGDATKDANLASAWSDPRMTQVIVDEHNAWSQNAGDLLVYFSLSGDFQWGFMSDVLMPTSPKMDGINTLNGATRNPSTYGTPIPATLSASSANVPPGWAGGSTSMAQRRWLGFSVNVSSQGVFKISLNASAASGAQAEILVDGNSIGTVTVPSIGDSLALTTPALSVGSHGIVVRNVTGTFNLNQVKVQTGP